VRAAVWAPPPELPRGVRVLAPAEVAATAGARLVVDARGVGAGAEPPT
jgi:hypothetical protein